MFVIAIGYDVVIRGVVSLDVLLIVNLEYLGQNNVIVIIV